MSRVADIEEFLESPTAIRDPVNSGALRWFVVLASTGSDNDSMEATWIVKMLRGLATAVQTHPDPLEARKTQWMVVGLVLQLGSKSTFNY